MLCVAYLGAASPHNTSRSCQECAALKLQLAELIQELDWRDADNKAFGQGCEKYRQQMEIFLDQRALLYVEHTTALRIWKTEKQKLEDKVSAIFRETEIELCLCMMALHYFGI